LGPHHGAELAERDMSRQVIEAAGASDQGLFWREPPVGLDPIGDELGRLDVRRLDIDGADAELLVPEQALIMARHVVLDEEAVAFDPAGEVRLVSSHVEVAVTDLAVVVEPYGVVPWQIWTSTRMSSGRSSIAMLMTSTAAATSASSAGVKYGSSICRCLQPASASLMKFHRRSLPMSIIIRRMSP